MQSLRLFLRSGRAAVTFLTRIPVGGFPYTDDEWRWASAWFPMIGALLGVIYGQIFIRLGGAGGLVAATLVIIAGLLITGAFHEDGLADSADALGGGYTRDRVLEILKDSRVGAFGAAALTVVLLLRVALIARLGAHAAVGLVVAECVSRTAPVWMMTLVPYATADAAAKSRLITRAGMPQTLVATAWPLALLLGLLVTQQLSWLQVFAIVVHVGIVTSLLLSKFIDRVGGVTGDFLGATQQILVCTIMLTVTLVR